MYSIIFLSHLFSPVSIPLIPGKIPIQDNNENQQGKSEDEVSEENLKGENTTAPWRRIATYLHRPRPAFSKSHRDSHPSSNEFAERMKNFDAELDATKPPQMQYVWRPSASLAGAS